MDNQQLDSLGAGASRGSRKELLGPRPTPLKVRKDSHKIRKPPIAPTGVSLPVPLPPPPQQQQEPRQPVIIYTVSPKIIHANPNEFMTLVQRLTGPDHATSSTSSICGPISPAARFASIEKTKMPLERRVYGGVDEGVEMSSSRRFVSGILSPGPSSLPPISPNFFSPFFNNNNNNDNNNTQNYGINNYNNNMVNLFQHGSNNYISTPFSSNNFISPGAVISPGSLDLLHQILNG